MGQSQPRIKGRRTVRHVVMVTPAQETELQAKATANGVTVSRLLVDAALNNQPSRRAVMRELDGIRRLLQEDPDAQRVLMERYGGMLT